MSHKCLSRKWKTRLSLEFNCSTILSGSFHKKKDNLCVFIRMRYEAMEFHYLEIQVNGAGISVLVRYIWLIPGWKRSDVYIECFLLIHVDG